MNHLKMVSDCFRKHGFISRTILNDVFTNILSDRQVRAFISKMEDVGIIQKESAGKYTHYTKTPDFPSFVFGPQEPFFCPKAFLRWIKNITAPAITS